MVASEWNDPHNGAELGICAECRGTGVVHRATNLNIGTESQPKWLRVKVAVECMLCKPEGGE